MQQRMSIKRDYTAPPTNQAAIFWAGVHDNK